MNYISGTVVLRIHVSVHFTYKPAFAFTIHHKDHGEPEKAKEEQQNGKEKLQNQSICLKKQYNVSTNGQRKDR